LTPPSYQNKRKSVAYKEALMNPAEKGKKTKEG